MLALKIDLFGNTGRAKPQKAGATSKAAQLPSVECIQILLGGLLRKLMKGKDRQSCHKCHPAMSP